jgi:hypothetical protein
MCLGFERIFDSCNQDGVLDNCYYDTPCREISDNFFTRLVGWILSEGPRHAGKAENGGDTYQKHEHEHAV